mmetsp:Transcript_159252/g.296974  ORF Transcript_159252/g.296974 Transcript_159252/m.296974 type:complete len:141 (+) Transcript_159252:67-489(+)
MMAFSHVVAAAVFLLALLAQGKLHERKSGSVASSSKARAMQPEDKEEGDWRQEYGHAKDPSVLKWKTDGSDKTPSKLPSQGFEGKPVKHANQKTITKDWTREYGPKGGAAKPVRSFSARGATSAFLVSALPLCVAMILMA